MVFISFSFFLLFYCLKKTGLINDVWRTIWLLLRLNLKHMCGLQLSVQLPHCGQLTCEWVDSDRTVLV